MVSLDWVAEKEWMAGYWWRTVHRTKMVHLHGFWNCCVLGQVVNWRDWHQVRSWRCLEVRRRTWWLAGSRSNLQWDWKGPEKLLAWLPFLVNKVELKVRQARVGKCDLRGVAWWARGLKGQGRRARASQSVTAKWRSRLGARVRRGSFPGFNRRWMCY